MLYFALLMVLISSPLMVEPCSFGNNDESEPAATPSPAEVAEQQQTDDAKNEAAANLVAAQGVLAGSALSTTEAAAVQTNLEAYATAEARVTDAISFVSGNLPGGLSPTKFDEIATDIQAKLGNGEIDALEAYNLMLIKVNDEAGASVAAELTTTIKDHVTDPAQLTDLKSIISNADTDGTLDPAAVEALAVQLVETLFA